MAGLQDSIAGFLLPATNPPIQSCNSATLQSYNVTLCLSYSYEKLLDSGALDGRRVGLVCNPASVDRRLRHVANRLAADAPVRLTALFGPQHGFRSDVQDNMIETRHARDEIRRVPVYSLYSDMREPTAEMLDDVDVLVIDLQDVGTRIYTYIYTMANCLQAAHRHGVKVSCAIARIRSGALRSKALMLVRGFESFVGSIPFRCGTV